MHITQLLSEFYKIYIKFNNNDGLQQFSLASNFNNSITLMQ